MKYQLSHTAAYIAVKFYGLSLNPKINAAFPDFIPKFYKNTVSYLPKHLSWNLRSLTSPFWRGFFIRWEELLLPGDLMHIISRKYYIHKFIQKAVNQEYEQIVVLGAGFDHASAYWSQKGVACFEIDLPSMVQHKQKMIEQFGYAHPNLHLLEILPNEQNLVEILQKYPSFKSTKKTIFITEGFFDYLTFEHTESILNELPQLCKNGKLISTFFDLDELPWFHRLMFKSGVSLVGETLKLTISISEFCAMLKEKNYTIESKVRFNKIEKEFIAPLGLEKDLPVLKGFYVLESHF